jgi:L-ascorbate metabolism protein UlaG (beta-lactamase superfamily)
VRHTAAVRRRFFGHAHVEPGSGAVDPDAVVLSWFGVSSFALAIAGRVLLLDAWIPRGFARPAVPASTRDLIDLAPDALLVGHGHFDHAADAVAVAAGSAATVVAAEEILDRFRQAGAAGRCIPALPPGAPVGARHEIRLGDGLEISAVHHVHSRPVAARDGLRRRVLPRPDPGRLVRHPGRARDLVHLAAHLGDRCGPCVLYQIRAGDVAITWHDSSGPLPERAPAVLPALRGLPPTSVHLGALMSFNQLRNGLRDVAAYAGALRPRLFVPQHHDNWLPPLTSDGRRYEAPLRAAFDEQGIDAEIRFLRDPEDYLRPQRLTFAG